jgi:hypothetical protein
VVGSGRESHEQAGSESGFDRFPLYRFDEDERSLLATFANSLNFVQAATELGLTPKALRSRLERLKAGQLTGLTRSVLASLEDPGDRALIRSGC